MLVPGVALAGAIDPDVALEFAEKASLGLSSGDGAGDVGVSVLVAEELVAEAVLDFVHGIAENVIGLLVLEVAVLVVLDLEVVAFFRTHVGTLGEGDILGAGLGTVAFATNICDVVTLGGAQRVWSGIYRRLGDGPFKVVHNVAEVASSALIGGKAVEDLITIGNEAT